MRLRDDDGNWTTAGDTVLFSYGIPPVAVYAKIVKRNGRLIALTPGHNPTKSSLRSLRQYVGCWYRQEATR